MKILLSSKFLNGLTDAKKIAFIAMFTALSVVTNTLLEIRVFDVQYSLTITFSFMCGIFLGPVFGCTSCIIGDLIGYFINSFGQLYMPWVGISTGGFAFFSGLVFSFETNKRYALYLNAAVFTVVSFLVCTILINSTCFYIYNRKIGFSDAFLTYVESKTDKSEQSFLLYLSYRLIFKGQILNSLVNYALIFISLPILKKLPKSKDFI